MDARGFARAGAGSRDHAAGWCGVASLLSLGGGFVALVGDRRGLAAVLGLAGAIGLVCAVLLTSLGTARVRYRPRRMTAFDWSMAAIVSAAPIALAVCSLNGDGSLVWFAGRALQWPALHVGPALALVPLLAPIVLPRGRTA
jgi:hypothetical protein